MAKRGRPSHDDVLTPREWEVLALLREGLTNEQIANRLGITEGGAKFHVSEILGKLGVSSRTEAARWTPVSDRRWALAGGLSLAAPTLSFSLAGKVLAASGAAAVAIGLLLATGTTPASVWERLELGSTASEVDSGASPQLQAAATATPAFIVSGAINATTWGAADQMVDFHVLRPGYVPDGLRLDRIVMSYFPGPSGSRPQLPTTRNGIVFAWYYSDKGYLSFEQGWGMGIPAECISEATPHGEVFAGDYTATWIQGSGPCGVGPPNSATPDQAYFRLGWRPDPQGATGPGWKLTTDFLTLDELVEIAGSLH